MDSLGLRVGRPHRLAFISLLLALLALGVAARALIYGGFPVGVSHIPVWFEILFGTVCGALLMAVAFRLWQRHRRDARAMGLALAAWAALLCGVMARAGIFAQADYERGRWPFFGLLAALMLLMAGIFAFVAHRNEKKGDLGPSAGL